MKIYLALLVIAVLVPFYALGLAAEILIARLWAWAIE